MLLSASNLSSILLSSIPMIAKCPNPQCLYFETKEFVKKDGHFYRRCESRFIQRFKCNFCKRKFSHATGTLEFQQRKRRVNSRLRELLCSGVSLQRVSLVLKINPITVQRKTKYLALKARRSQEKFLASRKDKVRQMDFDDMITSEHTKLKPLTISLAVDVSERHILGAVVAPIGAFGHLAEISRSKYGKRENKHKEALKVLFEKISPTIHGNAVISSDEHQNYPEFVRRYLPNREHRRYKGGRGCIVGQGELKKLHHDPLFILNHTCAMLRANVNRLIRKTWCTTKCKERLQDHLDIFVSFYNEVYLRSG